MLVRFWCHQQCFVFPWEPAEEESVHGDIGKHRVNLPPGFVVVTIARGTRVTVLNLRGS